MGMIPWLLIALGVIVFVQSWRQAREAIGTVGGAQRLRRWRFRVMLGMLVLVPMIWVMLQVFEGDLPFIIVGSLGALMIAALAAIELALAWHESRDQ